jgi:hypothetical protein
VRFLVLSVAIMKVTAFWDTAPRRFVVYRRSRGAYCLHHQGDDRPNGCRSNHLWYVGQILRECTAQYPRRLSSSNLKQRTTASSTSLPISRSIHTFIRSYTTTAVKEASPDKLCKHQRFGRRRQTEVQNYVPSLQMAKKMHTGEQLTEKQKRRK